MLVAGPNDDIEALKDEVMEDMADIFSSVDRSGKHSVAAPVLCWCGLGWAGPFLHAVNIL